MVQAQVQSLVIADEYTLVRDALAFYCERSGPYRVVKSCGDGEAALKAIEALRPHYAVVDLNLPMVHSFELVARVRQRELGCRVIILSGRQDRKTVLEALRTGASGYVLKSGPLSDLLEAFQRAGEGGVYLSPRIEASQLFIHQNGSNGDPLNMLSSREYQVFTLLVEGVRPKEIAARLFLSPKTVDTYRANLMKKLDIYDVAGLVKFALSRNLISA